MTSSAAAVMFGGAPVDTFYEDMAVIRKVTEQLLNGLPRLNQHDGMTMAAAGFAHVTVEPTTGYPDFTMPPIPGLFGVPYTSKEA